MSSSNSTHHDTGLSPAHDIHSPHMHTVPAQPNGLSVGNASGTQSSIEVSSMQTAQDGITGRSPDPQERMPSSPTTEYECQLEVITAGAIVAILVQLLTSQSMAITAATRALLSFCMVLELLGISLAICFVRAHHMRANHPSQPPLALVQHALRVPTVLILTGIVGLGVALVVETLETSLGTAVTMSGFLIFGVIICVSLLVYGLGGLVWGKAGARRAGDHV